MIEKEAPEATGIENQNLFFLEVAAEKLGDVKAQLILGKHYLAIEPDEEKALKYLEMAHNLGHAESTFLLGILYQSESEKIRNMNKSIELIQEAAVMGWPMAMAIIGDAYCRGKNGVERNIQTFHSQLKEIGLSFDWSRTINSCDEDYYKWTQWQFIQFFKKGLAEKQETTVNGMPGTLYIHKWPNPSYTLVWEDTDTGYLLVLDMISNPETIYRIAENVKRIS